MDSDGYYLQRVLITLPLERDADRVIPIPFIVDTGAPSMLILGYGARDKLRKLQVFKELYDANKATTDNRLNGTLLAKEDNIEDPIVDDLATRKLGKKSNMGMGRS